ncbi:hypothetical protein, partial [Nocardia iowensis]|uniref:hypothetical protein n=1 Tax=Nocardia iowensis TaxID=204891 RepID=UPI0033F0FD38
HRSRTDLTPSLTGTARLGRHLRKIPAPAPASAHRSRTDLTPSLTGTARLGRHLRKIPAPAPASGHQFRTDLTPPLTGHPCSSRPPARQIPRATPKGMRGFGRTRDPSPTGTDAGGQRAQPPPDPFAFVLS